MFNLEPVGEHLVQVCTTTPCWLRGSDDVVAACKKHIAPTPHTLSADGKFSWMEVECLGACVNAPMLQINDDNYEDLTPEILARILDDLTAGKKPKPGPQIDRQLSAPVGGPTTLTDPALYASNGKAGPDTATHTGAALHDEAAKKPGEPVERREAAAPKPPEADQTEPRRD